MFRTNTQFEMISLAISMRGAGGLTASFLGKSAEGDKWGTNTIKTVFIIANFVN